MFLAQARIPRSAPFRDVILCDELKTTVCEDVKYNTVTIKRSVFYDGTCGDQLGRNLNGRFFGSRNYGC